MGRVKTKNKNSCSKTELRTSTTKTSTTITSTTKTLTKTSPKTSPRTSTNTSTKTSLTVLMPKLPNDQILPSKMLKNSLQDRYQPTSPKANTIPKKQRLLGKPL